MTCSPLAFLIALLVMVPLAFAPASAQDNAASGNGQPQQEAEPAPADGGQTDDAQADDTQADDAAELPPEVVDPQIADAELAVRLLPLTVDELKAAADVWLGIVKEKTQEMADAQIAIMRQEGSVDDAARERLAQLSTERASLFRNYNTVIDAWEKKGGSEEEIATYRAYRSAIIVEETRTADYQTLLKEALNWAQDEEGGVRLAIQAGVVLIALIGLFLVARLVRSGAARAFRRIPQLSNLLLAFLTGIVFWLTIALGLMIVLSALGIDISPVFALFGGAAFILAFALQDTLGNLASGLMIMINRPFDVGDYVNAGGVAGTVKSVSIVSTTVNTPDNQIIIIPNKSVWGDVITNVTGSTTRRVDLVFGIGYSDSIEDAQRVLEETVAAHELVLSEPAPTIRVNELADSSVNFICRPWVKTVDYWTVYWDLQRQVKERFDAGGISIPFPQRDVHLYQVAAAPAGASALPPAALPPSGETSQRGTRERFAKDSPSQPEPGTDEEKEDER